MNGRMEWSEWNGMEMEWKEMEWNGWTEWNGINEGLSFSYVNTRGKPSKVNWLATIALLPSPDYQINYLELVFV